MKKKDTTPTLRRRRTARLRQLRSLKPEFLRGSLIERYKRCGKVGCKCAHGRGHGPKYYLSLSVPGGRPEMEYVPQDYVKQVEGYLANHSKARRLLEEICEINRELLRRREEL
ncbi:DUF6788 family protein [Candidatus Eisenbacteria bacterium]|uniref:DUF6788 family protein n=1 Tax=Eiseniibacteriota bacterium TaxID=2212470 RepID=A0ABV6YKQ8_UNCEI